MEVTYTAPTLQIFTVLTAEYTASCEYTRIVRHLAPVSSCTASFESSTVRTWHYGFIENHNSGRFGPVTTRSRSSIAWWEVNEFKIVSRSIVRQPIRFSCAHLKQRTKEVESQAVWPSVQYRYCECQWASPNTSCSEFRMFYFFLHLS